MSDPPKRRRRWFQFSLRTLLIGVTLAAIPCGYVGWQVKIVRERKEMLKDFMARGGICTASEPQRAPLIRRLVSDEWIAAIALPDALGNEYKMKVKAVFLEAQVTGFLEAPLVR